MTDELQRVGAVAGHMNTTVVNIYDSDHGRYSTDPCSSGSCTLAVAALLQETQDDNEADWQEHQLSPDDFADAAHESSLEPAPIQEPSGEPATHASCLRASGAEGYPTAVAPRPRKRKSNAFGEAELQAGLVRVQE
ncbi:hypothetical protein V5799_024316 [Amblyomma americanum]|uniref:Uncharacterized protein n=1 Tax=Amblyomma americanum TaxID=6943 RepID=A0AAQ4ECR4_AMBAM